MDALPFAIPTISRGFAALSTAASGEGQRIADRAASAISDVLGLQVAISARPLAGPVARSVGVARLALTLGDDALPASLEIDAGLLARSLERLAARPPHTRAALAASDLERGLLALVTLVAIDGAVDCPALARLVPRVDLEQREQPARGLVVALDLTVGDDRGRGQLVVPDAAVLQLGPDKVLDPTRAAAAVALDASLRRGTVSLAPDELAALGPGDVVLLDEEPGAEIALPGGLTLRGREEGSSLRVEEIRMTEAQAVYPLTLSVEIARVTITLGELARVERGTTLPLDIRKDGVVSLRAGERVIARGQLVDVEGALGVRVAQVGDLP